MKMSKNKIILVAIIALVVIALAVTMVVLVNKGNNDLPDGTDGTIQTAEPSGTESTDPAPTDPQVKTYTVTFKDHDGTVLKTETVEEGKAATAPADPTREGYTFEGWDKTFDKVTADMEVTATYQADESKPTDPPVITYTVTFKDHDGKVLKTQEVESGKAATAPADPSRAGYTFTGWDKSFNKITSDLVVTATYKVNETKPTDPPAITYTVTFKDHDGKVLKTQKVESGKAATAPADPSRAGYTFTGWDKSFNKITSDLVVTATYKINEYTVTFKDHDGKVLKTQKVESGKAATAPADPSRAGYTFTGWDKSFNKITSDLVVTATYKINEYTVTFKDHDGKVLKTQKVESGKAATAPADPSRAGYTFTGWDKSFNKITSDLVVTATYKINEYTVTFKDHDGKVLKTQKVESGKAATAPADPSRAGYTFTGWDKSFDKITSDLVVTATYKVDETKPTDPPVITYTVTFKDHDGKVLKTQEVESGKAATAPADPSRAGYTFTGWDKSFDKITSDLVVTATYKVDETKPTDPPVITYTVTFKDHDGKVLKTQEVESGKAATAPADPSRAGYTFTGWDKSFDKITSDLVVTATYKINEYTVTFKDYNGEILKTQKVESGKAATAPAEPTREHYQFTGWDKPFDNVTSDLVVTATYRTTRLIISAESVTVNQGDSEVTVQIRVKNNPGIMGAVLKVSVNDDVFAFASASKTGYPGLTLTAPGSATTSSPYTFMLDSLDISDEDKKDGTLFTITFKIKDTSVTGTYDVKLSCNKGGIFDENYNDLDVTFVNGTITIQ